MKKLLFILTFILLTGCGVNVNSLIEEGRIDEALEIIEKDPTKYEEENKKIQDILNKNSIQKFKEAYNDMHSEQDEHNPDKWTPGFDWMEGYDFFVKIKNEIIDISDTLERRNEIDKDLNQRFIKIFGCEPKSIEEAQEIVNKAYKALSLDGEEYCELNQEIILDNILENYLRNSNNVRVDYTDTSGFFVIENPAEYFKEIKLSEYTLANLFGIIDTFAGEVEFTDNTIEIVWSSSFGRGYYYCDDKKNNEIREEVSKNVKISRLDMDWKNEDTAVFDIEFEGFGEYKYKYLSLTCFFINSEGEWLQSKNQVLKNIQGNKLNVKVEMDFENITDDDLCADENGRFEYTIHYLYTFILDDSTN